MLTATGLGARRNADGSVTIKVSITDESRKGASIQVQELTGPDLQTLKQQIADQLRAADTANDDDVLSAAVVGVILATSKGVAK